MNFSFVGCNQIAEMVVSCPTLQIEVTVNENVVKMDNCLPVKDTPELSH